MEIEITKAEIIIRIFTFLLLVASALLLVFNKQTQVIVIKKTITVKDVAVLRILLATCSTVGPYHLLQAVRCIYRWPDKHLKGSHLYVAWLIYVLDQLALYLTFAVISAAMEHGLTFLTGVNAFQWINWCEKFSKFCNQVGVAFGLAYVACFFMLALSIISAFNLFRVYSPKKVFQIKRPVAK